MKTKNLFNRILAVLAAFLLMLFVGVESTLSTPIKAEEKENLINYDMTDVMDDLSAMTIDGELFELSNYVPDKIRDVQVLSFIEYCYSANTENQNNFGLYAYLFNPRQTVFSDVSTNKILFSYSNEYHYFPVEILDKSSDELFLKLKIVLSEEEKTTILESLVPERREYKISGIQLRSSTALNSKDYNLSSSFVYSGYAKGYGTSEESTLSCVRDSFESLELDLFHTYYRAGGSNGKNSFTQDTLMSVYFSIPNEVINAYDRLSKLSCSWIKAKTAWYYITGREDIYNAFLQYIGETQLYDDNNSPYYTGDDTPLKYAFIAESIDGVASFQYNYPEERAETVLDCLYYCFLVNDADVDILSGETIKEWMLNYHNAYGDENDEYLKVDGKSYEPYSSCLFWNDEAKTTYSVITPEDEFSLTEEKISQSWWQKLWGDMTLESSIEFDGIEGLKEVNPSEMIGTDEELSDKFYVNIQDIEHFRDFVFSENSENRTVYLLRYDIGEYEAIEATQGIPDAEGVIQGFDDGDTNARLCREDVYLNFDVIYAEFECGDETVVIPVVSTPTDVIPDSTPPLHTNDDTSFLDELNKTLKAIREAFLAIVVILLFIGVCWIIYLLKPIFIGIFKGVWAFICFPFKLIGKLFSGKKK